jgi:hypothetical protein
LNQKSGKPEIMVLKLGIGIGIGFLTAKSESDESAGIGRIGSVTRVFLAEALFCSQKIGKIDKNNL